MASLSNFLTQKSPSLALDLDVDETNLIKGQIFYFNPGTVDSSAGINIEWIAPSSGSAEIEIWGASGSGGLMCCCGAGVAGNPGAYSKKTIEINQGSVITGTIGRSCAQNSLVCRGRSEPTCVCYITGVMCAAGGIGGTALCGDINTSSYSQFVQENFCNTLLNDGCGTICNYRTLDDIAVAVGGDININGGWSCATFYHCNHCCVCSQYQHVKTSPALFATNGGNITYNYGVEQRYSNGSGANYHPFITALNAMSRQPTQGQPASFCWASARACGCFEYHGCMPYLPHGIPGPSSLPCSDTRSHGLRGGHGAVRIKFIGS